MARSVQPQLILPARASVARTEVADSSGRYTGWSEVLAAIDTLCEHYRASLVADASPFGVMITNAQIPRYKVPLQGESSSDEAVACWVYAKVNTAGSATLECEAQISGDVGTAVVNTTSLAWYNLGPVEISSGGVGDHDELVFTVSASTATIRVDAICVFYERDRTTLPAIAAGELAYPDGLAPHDLVVADGERALAPRHGRQAHENLRALYTRTFPFVASFLGAGALNDDIRWWRSEIPPQIVSRDVTARLYVWGDYVGGGTALEIGTITCTVGGVSSSAGTSSLGTSQWFGPFDLTLTAPQEGIIRPRLLLSGVRANEHMEVTHVSGWWSGLAYGA